MTSHIILKLGDDWDGEKSFRAISCVTMAKGKPWWWRQSLRNTGNQFHAYKTFTSEMREGTTTINRTESLRTYQYTKLLNTFKAFYNGPPPVPILSHTNPIRTLNPYFKTHFNIIPLLHLRLANTLFSSGYRTKLLCSFPISPTPISTSSIWSS